MSLPHLFCCTNCVYNVVLLISQGKVVRYFPTERGQPLSQGPITLSLTTQKTTPTHVERMISLQYRDQSLKRTVVHLQFTSWPELWVSSFFFRYTCWDVLLEPLFDEVMSFKCVSVWGLMISSYLFRGLPDSKSNLLRYIQEVHGHYLHQRPLHTPVVVHCRWVGAEISHNINPSSLFFVFFCKLFCH